MIGFFKKTELTKVPCAGCAKKVPKVRIFGKNEKNIAVVTPFPLYEPIPETLGKYRETEEGTFYARLFASVGIDLGRDTRCLSVFPCHKRGEIPEKQLNVTYTKCGWGNIPDVKKEYRLIFCFGIHATRMAISNEYKSGLNSVDKWVGYKIPKQGSEMYRVPLQDLLSVSPSFVEMSRKETEEIITDALDMISSGTKPVPRSPYIHQATPHVIDEGEAITLLRSLVETPPSYFCFDFETTGIKLYDQGHGLISCGICSHPKNAYAFFLTDELKGLLAKVISNPKTRFIQANIKYEEMGCQQFLGTGVANWYWDTMITAHLLDHKVDICSLKFQSFVQFGIPDYSVGMKKYIGAKGSNSINNMWLAKKEIPYEMLLYNAKDALYTMNLFMYQKKELERLNQRYFTGK